MQADQHAVLLYYPHYRILLIEVVLHAAGKVRDLQVLAVLYQASHLPRDSFNELTELLSNGSKQAAGDPFEQIEIDSLFPEQFFLCFVLLVTQFNLLNGL